MILKKTKPGSRSFILRMITLKYKADPAHDIINKLGLASLKIVIYEVADVSAILLNFMFPGPEPFQYGSDKCTVCNKTIQNTRSGGELITVKGRVLKFDSIGCLLKYYKAHESLGEEYTWITVIDYDKPGALIPVNDAVFLKHALNKDSFENGLIAVSKTEYSGYYLKKPQWTQGIYWRQALWRYR